MDLASKIQILNESLCVFICANIFGKVMNLSLFYPRYGYIGQYSEVPSFGKETSLEKSDFKSPTNMAV